MKSITLKNSFLNLLLIGALAFSVNACSETSEAKEQTEKPADEVVKTVNVEVNTINTSDFDSYLKIIGRVEAAEDVNLSTEASGRIQKVHVTKGQKIRKGQKLVTIDNRQLKRENERLTAMRDQTKDTYERQKALYEDENIGSEIDYLNSKYAYDQAQAALHANEVQLDNAVLKAPFDAIVEDVIMEEGEMASPSQPLLRIISSNAVKITAGVPARYADVIQVGDDVDLWFDTVLQDTVHTKITFVGNAIDPQSRTFEVEMALPLESSAIKIDMMANIRVNIIHQPNVLQLSQEFIYKKKENYVAYVVGTNDKGKSVAKERVIDLGPSYNAQTIIKSGLSAGDQVITIGSAFLKNNTNIKIVKRDGVSLIDYKNAGGDNE